MIAEDAFLEHANVFGKYYGTPKQYVLDKLKRGRNVLLEIDVQGALQVKKNYPKARMIFILPPSEEILLARLRGRGTETEEQVQKRFGEARKEMSFADRYDYKVVNDDLDAAVCEVKKLIHKTI